MAFCDTDLCMTVSIVIVSDNAGNNSCI